MRKLPLGVCVAALCLPLAAAAGNSLPLSQESPLGSQTGNTLTMGMQSAQQAGGVPADVALAGPAPALIASGAPVLQRGKGNLGSVTLTGTGGIQAGQCLDAPDGLWCRARFGETVGWPGTSARRQDEWPVLTYRAGCPDQAGAL